MHSLPPLIAIVGPTATGKSDLAVALAEHHSSEVVSADARQVYRGLDIGTGKITREAMRGVPHHLLDVADPREQYTVAQYKEAADAAIADIHAHGNTPILCGGSGFYIQAVVDNVILPEVPPDPVLRAKLEQYTTNALFERLRAQDPQRANTIDPHNRRRLIRALEIVAARGAVPKENVGTPQYETLRIGIDLPDDILRERIRTRLHKRLEMGMVEEAQRLHENGLPYTRMEELGLEYRYLARYLQGTLSMSEMERELETAIWQYAKRQRTWFRRDPHIQWHDMSENDALSRILRAC